MPISDVEEVCASSTRKKATDDDHMAVWRSLESAPPQPYLLADAASRYDVMQVLMTSSGCRRDVIYRSSDDVGKKRNLLK